ncbi:uncharacterized protein LOC133530706 [Cydia pomonella]|uniref:uncharacterized protein LOC133530706 n=1 Tax=Cydia pomonella TaxID=82600 RepID=UPI002ADE8430|nr:uncharacterized protein LOC133530706 [Cydia pomonella]
MAAAGVTGRLLKLYFLKSVNIFIKLEMSLPQNNRNKRSAEEATFVTGDTPSQKRQRPLTVNTDGNDSTENWTPELQFHYENMLEKIDNVTYWAELAKDALNEVLSTFTENRQILLEMVEQLNSLENSEDRISSSTNASEVPKVMEETKKQKIPDSDNDSDS